MRCHRCGREVEKGPMHVRLRCQRFPERQRDFCQWSCANDHMRDEQMSIDNVEITFLGSYGSGVGMLGR